MKPSKLFGWLALMLSVLPISPALGLAIPTIYSVVVLYPSKQLDIRGADFGTAPKIKFNGSPLTSTYNLPAQQVLANLGTIPPAGTYQLLLTRANGSNATVSVTIGAAGPQGIQGSPGAPASNEEVLAAIDASSATLQTRIDDNAVALQLKIDQSTAALQAKMDQSVATLQATIAALQNALQATAAENALKQDHSWLLTGLTLGNITINNGGFAVLEAAFPFRQYEYGFTVHVNQSVAGEEPRVYTLQREGSGGRFVSSTPYVFGGISTWLPLAYSVFSHQEVVNDTANWRHYTWYFNEAVSGGDWYLFNNQYSNDLEIWARRR